MIASSTTISQFFLRTDWFFLLTSLLTIAAGMLSVTRRNPVYAALWLMVAFAGMAGLFFRLDARFLAAIQVLVYAGAIMVLFLFVIMLLALRPEELGKEPGGPARLAAAVVSLFLAWALMILISAALGPVPIPVLARPAPPGFGGVRFIGEGLFGPHLLPFEGVSVLILAAIVGGIVLAKRKL